VSGEPLYGTVAALRERSPDLFCRSALLGQQRAKMQAMFCIISGVLGLRRRAARRPRPLPGSPQHDTGQPRPM
jgi:hypothetical protein